MAVEICAAHACLCCVGGSQEGRLLRDYFGQMCGSRRQVGCQLLEGVYVMAQGSGDADASVG